MEEELRLGRRTSEATGACLVRQRLTSREHSPVRQYVFSSCLPRSTVRLVRWLLPDLIHHPTDQRYQDQPLPRGDAGQGIVSLSGRGMLVVSVARQLGSG